MRRETTSLTPGGRTHQVRAVNPGPKPRKASLKRMVGLGSQVLDRLLQNPQLAEDEAVREQIMDAWRALEVAWTSTQADRRVALTRLQESLRQWTSEEAIIADDDAIQRYRRKLHLVLDH